MASSPKKGTTVERKLRCTAIPELSHQLRVAVALRGNRLGPGCTCFTETILGATNAIGLTSRPSQ